MKVFYKQVQLNPTTETDYTDLVNKPSINGVELEGDLSTEQIKVTWYGTQEEFDALPSHDPYTFYIIDDGTPVGTQDSYLDLADKPSINGQVLTGNKLPSDLDMYSRPDVDNLLASMRSIKVVPTKPAAPAANTMYYVGPDSESNYHVYLYDALLNEIDLGMAMNQLYREGTAIDIDSANTISVKIDDDTIKTNANNEIYVKKLDTTLTKGANTANAVKAVWVDNGDVKEHTVNSGNSTRPVYIDAGTIKPVNQYASGAYTNFVPYVANNGVLDGGQFIDFHTPTSTQDYDYRLFYNEGETDLQIKKSPSTPGATVLTTAHLDGTTIKWNNTNKTAYVPTTKSGDRWGVYPYTDNGGITAAGQAIDFYTSDTATGGSARLQFYPSSHKLVLGDYSQSPAAIRTMAMGDTVGNEYTPTYVADGVIKPARVVLGEGASQQAVTLPAIPVMNANAGGIEIGRFIDFHTITDNAITAGEDYAIRLIFGSSGYGLPNSLFLANQLNTAQSGTIVTNSALYRHPVYATLRRVNHNAGVDFSDYYGNSYRLATTAQNNGAFVSGSGLDKVEKIHLTETFSYSATDGFGSIYLSNLKSSTTATMAILSGFVNGVAITPSIKTETVGSSVNFAFFNNPVANFNITGFTLDITWTRYNESSTLWWGVGDLRQYDSSHGYTGVRLQIACETKTSSIMPIFEAQNGTLFSATVQAEVYPYDR